MARQRRRRGLVALACVLVLLGAGGAYAVADVRGDLPGLLTDDPVPQPYPDLGTAPGASADAGGAAASAPLDPDAPPADPAALAATIGPLLASAGLGTRVGASVVDGSTGEVLLAQGDADAYEPASVAKLLTAAAALETFGPDGTTTTSAGAVPGSDEVYLVGGGDLLLGAGAGDPAAVVGRAGLADLADQVAAELTASGTTTVRLRLDDSVVGGLGWGQALGPGVGAAGPRERVPRPAHRAGRRRRPHPPRELRAPGRRPGHRRRGGLRRRARRARGGRRRDRHPGAGSRGAAGAGVGRVRTAGATWSATPSRPATTPWRTRSRGWWRSRPARRSTSPAAAAPSWPWSRGSASPSTAWCWPTAAACPTGPGSARAASPRCSPPRPRPTTRTCAPLVTGLPVAALTGTLVDRFDGSNRARAAQGLVRAKTGSLTGTSSLAGTVVDADGRLLVFAVLADAVRGTASARSALDEVAAELARCGCS